MLPPTGHRGQAFAHSRGQIYAPVPKAPETAPVGRLIFSGR